MLNKICGAATLLLIAIWFIMACLPLGLHAKSTLPSLPMQECITEDSGLDPTQPCWWETEETFIIVPPAK